MSSAYNLDGIKTQIKKDLARSKFILDAWKAVSFPTKKDGKPFANFGKNFSGASYRADPYAMQAGENMLRVGGWCDDMNLGYIYSDVPMYELVEYVKDENMLAKKQNYMPKQTCLEQVYKYDLDDAKNAISRKIARLEKRVKELSEQLENADQIFHAYLDAYGTAQKTLSDSVSQWSNKDLYYLVRDTVKERYPYC